MAWIYLALAGVLEIIQRGAAAKKGTEVDEQQLEMMKKMLELQIELGVCAFNLLKTGKHASKDRSVTSDSQILNAKCSLGVSCLRRVKRSLQWRGKQRQ